MDSKPLFVFPKWSNKVAFGVIVALLLAPPYVVTLVAFGLSPVTLNVGYQPTQPVPYSHKLHAGIMGLDCRNCHNTVEKTGFAAIPPTDTCMNCHAALWNNADPSKRSASLTPVFTSAATGTPIKWVKVHDLPDFVYFNHSAHVNAGMSCVECHGKVNHMEQVWQTQPLNMAWCLECHRDPAAHIRPKNQITNLDWKPGPDDATVVGLFAKLPDLQKRAADVQVSGVDAKDLARAYVAKLAEDDPARLQREMGVELLKIYHIEPNTNCVTCHR